MYQRGESIGMDRRSFIQSAFGGAAGLLGSGRVYGSTYRQESEEKAVIFRTLGKTGIRVPVVSMGVMNADNPNLVKAALEAGIFHLDTAHKYQRGRNEEMIGEVIRDRPRDSFIIATKIPGGDFDRDTGAYTEEKAPEEFLEYLDISLQRLGLKYVDILYLHSVKSRVGALHEPLIDALLKARKMGKTRYIGLSTHTREPEVIRAAIESKAYEVVLTAYNFKQDHHEEVGRAIEEAGKAGLGIVAMKTIPGGGYADKERQKPLNIRAALKWVLKNEHVHTTIPGFTTFDQLQTDLDVLYDISLNGQEVKDLEEAMTMEGFYCQGCEVCLPQCHRNMPVSDLMRAHMYAYGYKNRVAAYDLLKELKIPAGGCGSCQGCKVVCAKSFNVRDNINNIMRLRDIPREFVA